MLAVDEKVFFRRLGTLQFIQRSASSGKPSRPTTNEMSVMFVWRQGRRHFETELNKESCKENERGRMIAETVGILLKEKESASETHLLANGLHVSRSPESVKPGAQTWKIQFAVS
jgi:hypothetical protein